MLREMVKSLRDRILPRSSSEERFKFVEVGFHGDLYLLELVDQVMSKCNSFVETGSNVGSTLTYVGKKYPSVQCFSCEPDPTAYQHALQNTHECANVKLFNEMSQSFMKRMVKAKKEGTLSDDVLFWLDAHDYGFEWPLREEMEIITSNWNQGFVLIDDFLVPGLDCFGFDAYDGQVCSFDYIKDSLNKDFAYHLYYPAYTDKTSKTHPLRGWGLIEFGHPEELEFSSSLSTRISKSLVNL